MNQHKTYNLAKLRIRVRGKGREVENCLNNLESYKQKTGEHYLSLVQQVYTSKRTT